MVFFANPLVGEMIGRLMIGIVLSLRSYFRWCRKSVRTSKDTFPLQRSVSSESGMQESLRHTVLRCTKLVRAYFSIELRKLLVMSVSCASRKRPSSEKV